MSEKLSAPAEKLKEYLEQQARALAKKNGRTILREGLMVAVAHRLIDVLAQSADDKENDRLSCHVSIDILDGKSYNDPAWKSRIHKAATELALSLFDELGREDWIWNFRQSEIPMPEQD